MELHPENPARATRMRARRQYRRGMKNTEYVDKPDGF